MSRHKSTYEINIMQFPGYFHARKIFAEHEPKYKYIYYCACYYYQCSTLHYASKITLLLDYFLQTTTTTTTKGTALLNHPTLFYFCARVWKNILGNAHGRHELSLSLLFFAKVYESVVNCAIIAATCILEEGAGACV